MTQQKKEIGAPSSTTETESLFFTMFYVLGVFVNFLVAVCSHRGEVVLIAEAGPQVLAEVASS